MAIPIQTYMSVVLLVPVLILPMSAASAQDSIPFQFDRVGTIGTMEGDPGRTFGRITTLGTQGQHVFFADHYSGSIHAFTLSGELIAAAGRKGKGPGEFVWPVSMAFTQDTLHVYDSGNLRISSYVLSGRPLDLVYVGDVRTPFAAEEMCELSGQFFFLGFYRGRLVHRIDRAGTVTKSFGSPFMEGHPVLDRMASDGLLHCDEVNGSPGVYVGELIRPLIRKYTPDGVLIWESIPPHFPPTGVTVTRRNSVQYSAPEGERYSTILVSLLTLPESRVLVQYGTPPEGARSVEEFVNLKTALLDGQTGRLLWYGESGRVPRLDLIDGGGAFSRPSLPFPHVAIYRWEKP